MGGSALLCYVGENPLGKHFESLQGDSNTPRWGTHCLIVTTGLWVLECKTAHDLKLATCLRVVSLLGLYRSLPDR